MTKRRRTKQLEVHSGIRRIRRVPRIPDRAKDAHKGHFGRVLVIGGSRGMIGAPALVANAALRSGAGLATVACPESIQPAVAILCPCATTIPLPEDKAGRIAPAASLKMLVAEGYVSGHLAPSAIAAGPGLGLSDPKWAEDLVRIFDLFGRSADIPVVLDADALNAIALLDSARPRPHPSPLVRFSAQARGGAIITPHPGEMARLCGDSSSAVQSDRPGTAVGTGRAMNASRPADWPRSVVALKGAGTIVTDGQRLYVNRTGNPGMATGGSGDVLTGVIAALIGQGMGLFDAAVLSTYLHGRAGDLAARQRGQHGLIATDVIEWLPEALRLHGAR